jgi:NhaP-type Na+/H+ or K+/H+ antiporter
MVEHYNLLLLLLGVAFLIGAFFPLLPRKLSISLPMLQLAFGGLVGYFFVELPRLNPLNYGLGIEKVTELVVLISLVGCGIKLDSPINWRSWQPTLRLLLILMPVGIVIMALLGHYIFGLGMAAAILLGAVLAPTDPVLAASIQVGPPNQDKHEDITRFSLTSEAGLNDGLAFPFVYLAIAIATAAATNQAFTSADWLHWLGYDVLWRIVGGLGAGFIVGKLLAKWLFAKENPGNVEQGYMVVALMLIAYGASELIHGYGFIAVFIAALTFRRSESDHEYHQGLHEFAEQSEGLLMSLVMIFLGILLGQILASEVMVTWQVYVVCLAFLLVIRPVIGYFSLTKVGMSRNERWVTAGLGIRGIGTFYYIAYAVNKGVFSDGEATSIWVICAVMVVMSVFIHGLSANYLLKLTKH